MERTKGFNKLLATILLILVLGFLIFAIWPYIKGLLGAFILFVLFKPVYLHLVNKKGWSKGLAAGLIILASFLIIIIPLSFAIHSLVGQVGGAFEGSNTIVSLGENLENTFPSIDISGFTNDLTGKASTFFSNILVSAINNLTKMIITWIIMYFVLYYMLIHHEMLSRKFKEFMPFNDKNRKRLAEEFKRVTTSTVISTGVIALLQGLLLGIGFIIFGLENALFWGFIGFILSLLPVVGTAIVWIPASMYHIFFQQNMVAGIGLIIWGILLGFSDYLTRPHLQRKFGKIHPLTTLVGIFIGLPLFGILGLILGPLLLSYSSLITKMYLEEYIN